MGSPCHVAIYAKNQKIAKTAAHEVIDDVQRLEAKYSRYRHDSLLNKINREAFSSRGVWVDEEMAGLLDYANTCHVESDGLFDVTSGILRNVWNFSTQNQKIPDPSEIAPFLEKIGWGDKVSWERPVIRFLKEGMELDFGGICKEYAADRAVAICEKHGITSGVVNFGGDLRVIGPHPDGASWKIAISHPRKQGHTLAMLNVKRGAVATSGDYERCIDIEGKRYSHILNPKTGWPIAGLTSVSVVAPFALIAGSASTVAMLKGKEEGPAWLESMDLPALWVDDDGNVHQRILSDL